MTIQLQNLPVNPFYFAHHVCLAWHQIQLQNTLHSSISLTQREQSFFYNSRCPEGNSELIAVNYQALTTTLAKNPASAGLCGGYGSPGETDRPEQVERPSWITNYLTVVCPGESVCSCVCSHRHSRGLSHAEEPRRYLPFLLFRVLMPLSVLIMSVCCRLSAQAGGRRWKRTSQFCFSAKD